MNASLILPIMLAALARVNAQETTGIRPLPR
jgi:hypothetical protein